MLVTMPTVITKTRIDAPDWDPYPLPADTIVEGDPAARVHWARASGPGEPVYYAGIWTAEPSVFDYTFELNETAHIVAGRVIVAQQDGPTLDLRAGDVAVFPRGARTRWTVVESLKKVFIDTP